MSILTQPRRRLAAEEDAEPPLRQTIEMLQQVMRTRDAEKLLISVLEAYECDCRESEVQSYKIPCSNPLVAPFLQL